MRGEDGVAALCRREGIHQNLHHRRSEEFPGVGKKRLAGDSAREATGGDARNLRREAAALKEAVADLTPENRCLKKHDRGWGDAE